MNYDHQKNWKLLRSLLVTTIFVSSPFGGAEVLGSDERKEVRTTRPAATVTAAEEETERLALEKIGAAKDAKGVAVQAAAEAVQAVERARTVIRTALRTVKNVAKRTTEAAARVEAEETEEAGIARIAAAAAEAETEAAEAVQVAAEAVQAAQAAETAARTAAQAVKEAGIANIAAAQAVREAVKAAKEAAAGEAGVGAEGRRRGRGFLAEYGADRPVKAPKKAEKQDWLPETFLDKSGKKIIRQVWENSKTISYGINGNFNDPHVTFDRGVLDQYDIAHVKFGSDEHGKEKRIDFAIHKETLGYNVTDRQGIEAGGHEEKEAKSMIERVLLVAKRERSQG